MHAFARIAPLGCNPKPMRIALNWFEVSLPSTELSVGVETIPIGQLNQQHQKSFHSHLVVQRRGDANVRLLHATDTPPNSAELQQLDTIEDPNFFKIVIENAFALRLQAKGFDVTRQHVGGKAYVATEESLWPDIYAFLRGLSFRGFYFRSQTAGRWGLVLNYITSQRFRISLDNPHLRAMATGKRIVKALATNPSTEGDRPQSGILLRVDGNNAVIDVGSAKTLTAPLADWTLPCRRELLQDFVQRTRSSKDAAELVRRLQQATFALTGTGRMNTSLAKDQIRAVQTLLQEHDLLQFSLPLPSLPPVSLTARPMEVSA